MRKFIFLELLAVLFIQSCQSPDVVTTFEEATVQSNQGDIETLVSPSVSPSVMPSSPLSSTADSPPIFNHSMFVESQAEGFEMIETEKPSDFIWEEVVDTMGNYRALQVCDIYCDIFVEELSSAKVYRLAAPSLLRSRVYADLMWSDAAILEFTLVTQPHHGVRFTVNIEAQKIINAVPTPLE